MTKRTAAEKNAPVNSLQLTLLLEQKQRLLGDNTDAIRRCENTINECREKLEEGRDHSHVRWLVPAFVLLLVGGLLAGTILPLAIVFFAAGGILAIRWLSGLADCLKKHSRVSKRLQESLNELDKLSEACSALRLETAELRQKIDEAEKSKA